MISQLHHKVEEDVEHANIKKGTAAAAQNAGTAARSVVHAEKEREVVAQCAYFH